MMLLLLRPVCSICQSEVDIIMSDCREKTNLYALTLLLACQLLMSIPLAYLFLKCLNAGFHFYMGRFVLAYTVA